MPDIKTNTDYSLISPAYNALIQPSGPIGMIKDIAKGRFTEPDYPVKLAERTYDAVKKFDNGGRYGQFVPFVGSTSAKFTSMALANTEEGKKFAAEALDELDREYTELLSNKELDKYKGIKAFGTHFHKQIKGLKNKDGRFTVTAENPGGYNLLGSADWTDKPAPGDINAFNNMLVNMKYDELFELGDERAELEMEIRGKVLSDQERAEANKKFTDINKKVIEILKHQMSKESEEKYSGFFQKYNDTITGNRGNSSQIDALEEENAALENGWDISRLNVYRQVQKIVNYSREAQEVLQLFDDPRLDETKKITSKLAELDPKGKKFNSNEELDKYLFEVMKGHKALIKESKKPGMKELFSSIDEKCAVEQAAYSQQLHDWEQKNSAYEKDPINNPKPGSAPQQNEFARVGSKSTLLAQLDGKNKVMYKYQAAVSDSYDPEYYPLHGDKEAVEKRKEEIAKTRALSLTEGMNAEQLDLEKSGHISRLEQAEKFKANVEAAANEARELYDDLEKLGELSEGVNTKEYQAYKAALKEVAALGSSHSIEFASRDHRITDEITPEETNDALEKLAMAADAYYGKLEGLPSLENDDAKVKENVETVQKIFPETAKQLKIDAAGLDPETDVKQIIADEKNAISIIDKAAELKGITPEQMANAHFKNSAAALDDVITCSEAANKMLFHHKDFDDAVIAMKELREMSRAYPEVDKNNTEEYRNATEAMQEKAKETAKKLQTYLDRKSKEGSLNEKGQQRVKTFEDALKVTKDIAYSMDDRILDLDRELADSVNAEMLRSDLDGIQSQSEKYKAQADELAPVDKIAATYASIGTDTIKKLIEKKGELTEEDKLAARTGLASVAIHETGFYDKNSVSTLNEYKAQLDNWANDPSFVKIADVSKDGLREFFFGNNAEKVNPTVSAARLLDRYKQEVKAEKARDAERRLNDQPEENLDKRPELNGPKH